MFVFLQCISSDGCCHNERVFRSCMLPFRHEAHRQTQHIKLTQDFYFLSIALLDLSRGRLYLFVVEFYSKIHITS